MTELRIVDAPADAPQIIVDEALEEVVNGERPIPGCWGSRALYLGEVGAQNWAEVVSEPNYPLRDDSRFQLGRFRLEAIRESPAATLVSLGPGDGVHDIPLLEQIDKLRNQESKCVRYIGVDISKPLLERALGSSPLRDYHPLGVVCDFEDNFTFLAEILNRFGHRPILFALLGGTVGNLDGGLHKFFHQYREFMRSGDAFLVDLPIAGVAWSKDTEPRLQPDAYSTAFRRFLAAGALRKLGLRDFGRKEIDDIISNFPQQFVLSLQEDEQTGANLVTVTDVQSGDCVLQLRRFRWQRVLSWFRKIGFKISFAECSLDSDPGKFGMGVALLALP